MMLFCDFGKDTAHLGFEDEGDKVTLEKNNAHLPVGAVWCPYFGFCVAIAYSQ